MALEMRTECERCGKAVTSDSPDVWICSFECTFCADCAGALDACPNCGGELVRRPRRTP